ncbi:MAG: hypothetical protein KAT04_11700 [Methylococcales bacterium]|nr:hypothetical protein [Methylococcales bacterium]
MNKKIICFLIPLIVCSCTATPPKNVNSLCEIFREKDDWYSEAKESYQKWGVPIHVIMAIMHQESHFVADAQPPRPLLLGFIPWFRSSSAYGYAQAQDGTWDEYLANSRSHWSADRDDFYDTSDFIGWYCTITHQKLGISKWDTHKLYLAYHEGHGGYHRKTYLRKKWLLKVASKVDKKSKLFRSQLASCKEELESKGWFFW